MFRVQGSGFRVQGSGFTTTEALAKGGLLLGGRESAQGASCWSAKLAFSSQKKNASASRLATGFRV